MKIQLAAHIFMVFHSLLSTCFFVNVFQAIPNYFSFSTFFSFSSFCYYFRQKMKDIDLFPMKLNLHSTAYNGNLSKKFSFLYIVCTFFYSLSTKHTSRKSNLVYFCFVLCAFFFLRPRNVRTWNENCLWHAFYIQEERSIVFICTRVLNFKYRFLSVCFE